MGYIIDFSLVLISSLFFSESINERYSQSDILRLGILYKNRKEFFLIVNEFTNSDNLLERG